MEQVGFRDAASPLDGLQAKAKALCDSLARWTPIAELHRSNQREGNPAICDCVRTLINEAAVAALEQDWSGGQGSSSVSLVLP